MNTNCAQTEPLPCAIIQSVFWLPFGLWVETGAIHDVHFMFVMYRSGFWVETGAVDDVHFMFIITINVI